MSVRKAHVTPIVEYGILVTPIVEYGILVIAVDAMVTVVLWRYLEADVAGSAERNEEEEAATVETADTG